MEKPKQNGYVSIFQQYSNQKSSGQGDGSIFSNLMKTPSNEQNNSSASSSCNKSSKKTKKPTLTFLEEQSTTLKKIQLGTDPIPSIEIIKVPVLLKEDIIKSAKVVNNKIEVIDHTKPRRQSSIRIFQQLLQWLFTKQGINPLWIVIEDRHMIQNFVYISITVPSEFEKRLLNKTELPFLSSYYEQKNIAVFKERIVKNDDNYWHQLFQTKLSDDISLPLFNKNQGTPKDQISEEEYQAMNYEQKLYYKYSQFCHSKLTLKNNLYPTEQEDFPDFISSSTSTLDFNTVKFENKILGVDCEMVSTENGLELARLSIVNFDGVVLVDQLVKTPNRIINYNTQYSGITMEMLKDVTVDLKQAQDILLKYVTPETILIGHSLENDLIALQVIHNKVIDTSLLYLTKTERKLKLRDLTQKFLNCKIQQGSHCPCEDANSALSLAKLRIEILDKFDNSKIVSGTNQVTLDLLDQIIKINNTVLILDETENLQRLMQYGVHYDELKQNSNEQRLEKILKWVKKKKRDNCILPRIIMTQLIKEKKQMSYKELDSKLQEIVENSPSNSVYAFNFEIEDEDGNNSSGLVNSNPFCIFVGV